MGQKTEERNLELLERYFEKGCKSGEQQRIGVELEHFVSVKRTGQEVSYYGEDGVGALLKEWEEHFPVKYREKEALLGLSCQEYSLTLEPAAQLEISIAPQRELKSIYEIYRAFCHMAAPSLERRGYELVTRGYRTAAKADALAMIPKQRYEWMDRYFQSTGIAGRMMMRGTASAQVSIDYRNEQDFIRKCRVLSTVMPVLKLITDNTPAVEGKEWKKYLARTWIWNHVDAGRCGMLPGVFETDFGFRKLAVHLWKNLEPVFLPGNTGAIPTGRRKVRELWEKRLLSSQDIEHIISMTFPDIRVKQYLELRGADSMPIPFVMGYAALVRGLTQQEQVMEEILERYPADAQMIRAAENSLMQKGFEGEICGVSAWIFAERLLQMAEAGLCSEERGYLAPVRELTERKMTVKEWEKNRKPDTGRKGAFTYEYEGNP